jgi:prophage tail gpP-like protein
VTVATYDSVGGKSDEVQLILGEDLVVTPLSYEVTCSVFSQPAAFALEFGWGETTADLIARFPKGTKFQIHVAGVPVQTGRIDAIGAGGGATVVRVRGRDNVAPLFKDTFLAEQAFKETTYHQLTRKMMDAVGLGGVELHSSNTANRKAITGHKVIETKPPIPSDTLEIETQTTGGQRKVEYKKIKSSVGQRRYDFLQEHYRKAGLFLWAAGDGSLVLATPNGDQEPSYSVARARGQTVDQCNVKDHTFDDNAAERYAKYIVYGRTGAGKGGRTRVQGEWPDPEIAALGFAETKSIKDDTVKTSKEAQYAARREGALQIRNGWKLSYVFAGHLMPSMFDRGAYAIWAPDTVCKVVDEELGLEDTYYVSDVTFRRNISTGTTTEVRLMRRDGLVFAEET